MDWLLRYSTQLNIWDIIQLHFTPLSRTLFTSYLVMLLCLLIKILLTLVKKSDLHHLAPQN